MRKAAALARVRPTLLLSPEEKTFSDEVNTRNIFCLL
jgi:hypothetical protein